MYKENALNDFLSGSTGISIDEKYFATPIEDMDFSVRSYNALSQNGITTLGQLNGMKANDLMSIRNLGKTSVNEIFEKLTDLNGAMSVAAAPLSNPSVFTDKWGVKRYDVSIDDMHFSVRAYNVLNNNGCTSLSQLVGLDEASILSFRNAGKLTVAEILSTVEYYKDTEIVREAPIAPADAELAESLAEQILAVLPISASSTLTKVIQPLVSGMSSSEEKKSSVLYSNALIRDALKARIRSLTGDWDCVKLTGIFDGLPDCLKDWDKFQLLIDEMCSDGHMTSDGTSISRIQYSVMDLIGLACDERNTEIVRARLTGKTLDEVGQMQTPVITRERIRQIVSHSIARVRAKYRSLRPFIEERYANIFNEYKFTEEAFTEIFNAPPGAFGYLLEIREEARLPQKAWQLCIGDPKLPEECRVRALKYLDSIPRTKAQIRRIVLKNVLDKYCESQIRYDDFHAHCMKELALVTNGEANPADYANDFSRGIVGRRDVLSASGQKLRHYEIDAHDYTRLFDALQLDKYSDVEISARKFFLECPGILEEYDIRDEDELHNLLKKLLGEPNDYNLSFGRMPTLKFGECDRDQQVTELLLANAPISVDDLAKLYEKEYGNYIPTVKGTFFQCITKYLQKGMFVATAAEMQPFDLITLKSLLTKDFYTLAELRSIFIRTFPQLSLDLINDHNMRRIGLRLYGSYALKQEAGTAFGYMQGIIDSKPMFTYDDIPSEMRNLSVFLSALTHARNDGKIFETSSKHFASADIIHSAGIMDSDIEDYCRKVSEAIPDGTVFTVMSAADFPFPEFDTSAIPDFDFNWFRGALLASFIPRFQSRLFGNGRVFFAGKVSSPNVVLIRKIIEDYGGTSQDIQDLMYILREEYGITISKNNLAGILDNAGMDYDSHTGIVEIDSRR